MSTRAAIRFGVVALFVSSAGCSSCSTAVRERALHQYALDLCGTMTHAAGAACAAEVERRFPGCSRPFLAHETSSEDFAACLGFSVVPASGPPATVVHCETPDIVANVSVSLAKSEPWAGSTLRVVDGRQLHVSTSPVITTADLVALRLEGDGEEQSVRVQLSSDAAKRLEEVTESNIGQSMLLVLNESEVAVRIASALSGPTLILSVSDVAKERLCSGGGRAQ